MDGHSAISIILWVVAGLGIILAPYVSLTLAAKIPGAPEWPRALATITESRLDGPGLGGGGPKPHIRFRYAVQGAKHTSAMIRLSPWKGTMEEARALIEAHPVGARVWIYYDPSQTMIGVIEPVGDAAYHRNMAWRAPAGLALALAVNWLIGRWV